MDTEEMDEVEDGLAKKRYSALETKRLPFLERARACSELTIPTLLPPVGHQPTSQLPTPYQSIGARGLNVLASKLTLTLFPPNTPSFRMNMDDATVAELAGDDAKKAKIDLGLSRFENIVQDAIEGSGDRGVLGEGIKHILNGGNVLFYKDRKTDRLRLFLLDSYVVCRDPSGNLLEGYAKECVAFSALPPDVRSKVAEERSEARGDDDDVDLYHCFRRNDNGKYDVWQEVECCVVDGSQWSCMADDLPFIAPRLYSISGESYSRGYVEEYFGDLRSLEVLSQALVEGSSVSAKIVFLVSPSGVTKASALSAAKNGAIINGDLRDVGVLQFNKQADLAVTKQTADAIEQRLALAFLLNTSIQRSGERVTAEEIRYMAQELEDALGGIYSSFSLELLLPYIRLVIASLRRKGKIPKLPDDAVKLQLVTGLAAIGRGHDLQKLTAFMQAAEQSIGPQAFLARVNVDELLTRIAAATGVNPAGLVKTPEQIAQEQDAALQHQQQQALTEAAVRSAPAVAGKMTDAYTAQLGADQAQQQ